MRRPPTYGDFVEAMRQKKVYGHANGALRDISRLERRRNWAIPSYDFGHLLDPTYRGNLLSRIPATGQVPIPGRDCAFLFTVGAKRQLLIQRFQVNTYPGDNGGVRVWFYETVPDGHWLSMDGKRELWERLAFDATYLLANPQIIKAPPNWASVKAANQRRRMSSAAPIPPTTGIIRLTRIQRLGAAATGSGLGAPKRPHDRLGHRRRLRDGRVIPVRPCEINKGLFAPPQNLVVRP
jgi:hypothetical protein